MKLFPVNILNCIPGVYWHLEGVSARLSFPDWSHVSTVKRQGCHRYKDFGSPNKIQNQIKLPDTKIHTIPLRKNGTFCTSPEQIENQIGLARYTWQYVATLSWGPQLVCFFLCFLGTYWMSAIKGLTLLPIGLMLPTPCRGQVVRSERTFSLG